LNQFIAKGLHLRNIDVLTTAEAKNRGIKDDQHLAFALAQNRVLVTRDEDFLILSGQGIPHAGIVYYKSQTRTVKEVLRGLWELYEKLTAEEMLNMIRFL
jgi:predicted nuclease of predicted toxin-antitoxin system